MPSYVPKTQIGRGTTLTFTADGQSGTPAVTSFLSLVSVTPPQPTLGEVEVTLLSSAFEPYLATIPAGEGSLKVNHWDNDPGCVAMQAAANTPGGVNGVFLLTMPSGATFSWDGFPKSYKIDEIQTKEKITSTIDYRQNTAAVYTPAPNPT